MPKLGVDVHPVKSLEVSPYELSSPYFSQKRRGSLLRVEFEKDLVGYGDCHPWEELGDASIDVQLDLLRQGLTTSLTERSLFFARLDAEARAKKVSLFDNIPLPSSHYLIPHLETAQTVPLQKALDDGFTHFKIKLGKNWQNELIHLKKYLHILSKEFCKLRFDFNLKVSQQDFLAFLSEIRPWEECVDFCEDPFPFERQSWKHVQKEERIALACDQQCQQAMGDPSASQFLVLKPAVQSGSEFRPQNLKGQRFVVTSYMDHPLGQMTAAYMAGILYQTAQIMPEKCGLLSHLIYQTNEFSEQIPHKGPFLQHPGGTGFGFDELFDKRRFVRLS